MRSRVDSWLESRIVWLLARLLIVVMFFGSGLAKLFDFDAGVAEMQAAGLQPAWAFNIAVALVLLAGAVLVLLDKAVWLGAGMLSVFLLLTIVIVHTFWRLPEPRATYAMFFALEHLSVVGGLMSAAIASHWRRKQAMGI